VTSKILHIIEKFSGAGPTRSLIACAKYSKQLSLPQQHRVVTLQSQAYPIALVLAKQAGVTVIRQPTLAVLQSEIINADIVQVHFWNSPQLYEFLHSDLPPMRLLLWFKILGNYPPQVITEELLNFADWVIPISPDTLKLPIFQKIITPITTIPGIADFERLKCFKILPHSSFNVGYIGTVNFSKMHSNYIPMHAAIEIPNVQFIICGGINEQLQQQAEQLGVAEKFHFKGYVENIQAVLAELDVFGYPLCKDTYATSEKSLQEAMYAGIPPVVFPHGGITNLVQDGETGLIVNNEQEYQNAIEYLYRHPEVRQRLGNNAQKFIQKQFSPENAVLQFEEIYQQLKKLPKRQRQLHSFDLKPSLAQLFIRSLGDSAPQFVQSLLADDIDKLLVADQIIASISPLLAKGEGGVIQYRNYYSDDCFLRFWSGLISHQEKKYAQAIKEWQAAIELGFQHWRVYWYLAQAFTQLDNTVAKIDMLNTVIQFAPYFEPAQEALKQTLQDYL
jgi:glycosyltransferase involved in cell wall biosynthesis